MMNRRIFFALIIGLLITVSCRKADFPVIYLVGDSTMANKPLADNPERGWGQLLPEYFSEEIVIENHAMNGRSTRSFIYESRWDTLVSRLKKGDFVVIQFGHRLTTLTFRNTAPAWLPDCFAKAWRKWTTNW